MSSHGHDHIIGLMKLKNTPITTVGEVKKFILSVSFMKRCLTRTRTKEDHQIGIEFDVRRSIVITSINELKVIGFATDEKITLSNRYAKQESKSSRIPCEVSYFVCHSCCLVFSTR